MKLNLQCFHPSEKTLGEAFDMEEMILGEFDRIVFRCPECKKEVFVTWEVERPYG